MSRDETTMDSSEQSDPRVIEVVMADDGLMTPGGTLHRYDQNKSCYRNINTNVSTDLMTAAVHEGRELCEDCEWPNGAEGVLQQ